MLAFELTSLGLPLFAAVSDVTLGILSYSAGQVFSSWLVRMWAFGWKCREGGREGRRRVGDEDVDDERRKLYSPSEEDDVGVDECCGRMWKVEKGESE